MFLFCQGRAYSLTILGNILFGIARGPATTETNTNQRAKDTQSIIVFRLQTYENTSPTASEPLQVPTMAAGHSNLRNSDPNYHNHFNHRTAISLKEISDVSVSNLGLMIERQIISSID
ncbi:hypothetical protein C8J57DRAFT_1493934 [Mycena rebaudengoi]|nr:hypothetical protein C8J57DRAFT_1493934 [Mycena rebaudengoi]